EKTPADTLSKPSEKVPSTQPSEARRVWNPLPLTLSDIKAFVSRLTGGASASSEASKSDTNSKKPASHQQRYQPRTSNKILMIAASGQHGHNCCSQQCSASIMTVRRLVCHYHWSFLCQVLCSHRLDRFRDLV